MSAAADDPDPNLPAPRQPRIFASDPRRRIRLPGVGDVERPVDIDSSHTGFEHLVSLRIYLFREGQIIDGEAEGDEVCVVFLRGGAILEVANESGEQHRWRIAGRAGVFDGPAAAVYLPPHHRYRLTPDGETLVAYARAAATGTFPARRLDSPEGTISTTEPAGHRLNGLLPPGAAEHLVCWESVTPAGAWRSPYRHQRDRSGPGGGDVEEIVYHRIESGIGVALAHIHTDKDDRAVAVRDGDALAIAGRHALVAPQDARLYCLHVLAGSGAAREQSATDREP